MLVATGLAGEAVAFVLEDITGGYVMCSLVATGLVWAGVTFALGDLAGRG